MGKETHEITDSAAEALKSEGDILLAILRGAAGQVIAWEQRASAFLDQHGALEEGVAPITPGLKSLLDLWEQAPASRDLPSNIL